MVAVAGYDLINVAVSLAHWLVVFGKGSSTCIARSLALRSYRAGGCMPPISPNLILTVELRPISGFAVLFRIVLKSYRLLVSPLPHIMLFAGVAATLHPNKPSRLYLSLTPPELSLGLEAPMKKTYHPICQTFHIHVHYLIHILRTPG